MADREFDPVPPLQSLHDHGVRYVLIGGVAANAHGSPSITHDLDVCYARHDANLDRLATALQNVNARLRGVSEEVPLLLDAQTLKKGDNFTFVTDYGSLDCLGTRAGVTGFDELNRNATDMDFGGLVVRVAGLEDLMRMKRAAGRPKDRVELEILGALREEIEASE